MDPMTHVLSGVIVGSLLGGDGVETAVAVGAAIAPDAEFLTRKIPRTAFLDYHHGITHTIAGGAILSIGWAVLAGMVFGRSWVSLLPVSIGGVLMHILLDLLMHNNGVALLAPFSRKRYACPVVLGLNPNTASKKCKEGRYGTCFVCQAHGSLFNPFMWVFLGASALALASASLGRPAAVVSCLLLLGYVLFAQNRKRTAIRIASDEDNPGVRQLVFPASPGPYLWLIVKEQPARFRAVLVDTKHKLRLWTKDLSKPPVPAAVKATESLISVRGFKNSVIFPFWSHEREGNVDHVAWHDLSYLFSSDVELYTLHIKRDQHGEILQNEFHERW